MPGKEGKATRLSSPSTPEADDITDEFLDCFDLGNLQRNSPRTQPIEDRGKNGDVGELDGVITEILHGFGNYFMAGFQECPVRRWPQVVQQFPGALAPDIPAQQSLQSIVFEGLE